MASAKIGSQMFIGETCMGFVEVKIEDTSREEANELADKINDLIAAWNREKTEEARKAFKEFNERFDRNMRTLHGERATQEQTTKSGE